MAKQSTRCYQFVWYANGISNTNFSPHENCYEATNQVFHQWKYVFIYSV